MDVFGILNFVLAAAMYTLLGRFVLSLFVEPENPMVLWKVFQQVTNPIVNGVGAITPAIVPDRVVILFAALWCLALRIGLFLLWRLAGVAG